MKSSTMMTPERAMVWERRLLGNGVVAALLYLTFFVLMIGFVLPQMPALDATDTVKAEAYARLSHSPVYATVSILIQMQLPFLLLFFAGLHSVLRRVEGATEGLSTAVLVAGVAVALICPLAEFVERHLLLGMAAAGVDPHIVVQFDGLTPMAFALSSLPQALVLAGCAVLILSQGGVLRWLGWAALLLTGLSLVAAVMLFVPAFFPAVMLGAIFFRLWVLALSIALLRRPHTVAVAALQTAAA